MSTAKNVPTARPAIETRDLDFDLPDDVPRYWHSGNPWITHYFNGLSTMFPDGEKFFMDAVRHYRPAVEDPELLEAIRGFLGQEGIHAREHRAMNAWLVRHGVAADRLERVTAATIAFDRKLPWAFQLAVTAALEHFTAIMADVLLRDPRALADAHPAMQRLWRWHAMEEAEHKAVAFDVLQTAFPGWKGYALRVHAMFWTTLLFTLNMVVFQLWLVAADGKLGDVRGWWQAQRFFFVDPGVARKAFGDYFSWYRPSFHPWDHDNADLVEKAREAYAA